MPLLIRILIWPIILLVVEAGSWLFQSDFIKWLGAWWIADPLKNTLTLITVWLVWKYLIVENIRFCYYFS
jgi:hypothetical protein